MESTQRDDDRRRTFKIPRVGQYVRLRDGRIGHVVYIERALDVVRRLGDIQARDFVGRKRATYGELWEHAFYIADVRIDIPAKSSVDLKVEASQVQEVMTRFI